jgi:hypothetical protein
MWTIAAALLAAQTQIQLPSLPDWMAGCWERKAEDQWTEECWTAPRAGIMLGSSRSGAGDVLLDWETMQIVREETDDPAVHRLTFWGSPRGESRTMFTWRPSDEPGLAFYNLSHDYPQLIRYWREGENLIAEISQADGSKPRRWRYSPKR